jgi:hypothetical protein
MEAMKAFITHQADYAKFLYMEECKRTGRHQDLRKANAIWKVEYESMNKALKKIKEDEDKARNEFDEEKKKHLDERRSELLAFIREEEGCGDTTENERKEEGKDEGKDEDPSKPREQTEEESELEELGELSSYIKDLDDAYENFSKDSEKIMPGIENRDLEEYSYVLTYCQRLFDLAIKHDKMNDADHDGYESKIKLCLDLIEQEFARRRDVVLEQQKQQNEEWLEGLIPKKPGSKKRKGGGKGKRK